MTGVLVILLTSLAAYLIGAIPFGYLIARARGVDIFAQGSGNIGATNVGRVLGKRFGVLVFVLDFAKGALPVLGAFAVARSLDPSVRAEAEPALEVATGLAAFLGHCFPVYLGFRGGKGVATGAGVIAVLVPGPALGAVVVWLGVVLATRTVSLASLAAGVALCVVRLLTAGPPTADNLTITLFCLLAAGLVFLRHRANLGRLLHGTENRIKDSPAMCTLSKTVHVLALGLWFGTAVFFTFFVALTIFGTLESIGADVAHRPAWFPRTPDYEKVAPPLDGPREQGTRAAGRVINPLFGWYFLIQGVCGFLAAATALGWPNREPGRRVHRVRVAVLLAALLTVVAGWPLEQHVNQLREPRNTAIDNFLRSSPAEAAAAKTAALEARSEFGLWHMASVFLNLGTVVLVAVAMALAAQLPAREPREAARESAPTNGEPQAGAVPIGGKA